MSSSTPPEAYAAAIDAAWPGLPDGIDWEQAQRRIRAAVDAVVPIIRRRIADQIRSTIVPGVHMPAELQPTGGVANTRAVTAEWAAKIALGYDTTEDA